MFGSQYHPCLASNCHRAQVIGKLCNVTKSTSVFIVTTNTREKQFKIRKAYVGSWSQRFQPKTDLIPLLPVWSQKVSWASQYGGQEGEGWGEERGRGKGLENPFEGSCPWPTSCSQVPVITLPPPPKPFKDWIHHGLKPLTELEPCDLQSLETPSEVPRSFLANLLGVSPCSPAELAFSPFLGLPFQPISSWESSSSAVSKADTQFLSVLPTFASYILVLRYRKFFWLIKI